MSNQVAPATFSFESHNVRIITDGKHPLFVARDVALALGYKRPNDAITQFCKGAAKHRPLQTEGGMQEVRVIEEPDVYRLIFGSKLESAQKFQDWVFEEVLPTISKTGSYLTLEQQDSIKALHRELVKAAPKDLQGKLAIRLWSAVKSKYGVTYKEVPPTEYAEILSLMARTAQEMPLLVEEKPAHIAVMDFDTRRDGEWRVYIRDGKAYRLAAMYATVQGDPYAPR